MPPKTTVKKADPVPVKQEVSDSQPTPSVDVQTESQHSSLIKLGKDLYDLEMDLQKQCTKLQGSSEESQSQCEIIRLGAANLLRQAQAKMLEVGNLLDKWREEYQLFLKEKGAVDKSKQYLDDLSGKISQQQAVLARAKDITDVQMQNLLALCSLPDEKFQPLLS